MKPIYVVLFVLAGALGGAVMMKVALKSHTAAPVAQVQTAPVAPAQPAVEQTPPAPVPVPPAPPEQPAVAQPAKPSPMRREAPKPAPIRPVAPPTANPEPVEQPAPEPPPPPPAADTTPSGPTVAPPPARPPEPPPAAAPPAPAPHQVTLNAGMMIPVRLVDGLSSERNVAGDKFLATLDKELVVDGFVIAERGARVEGKVVSADRGGKVKGLSNLVVELRTLHTSDGQTVQIRTETFTKQADATHKSDAEKVGAGAAIGAVIGALAGGGKGAAIGAGVGGGAGAGDVLLTRGKPAELPSETRLTFRLAGPVHVVERMGN